jgi:hypothetical protein
MIMQAVKIRVIRVWKVCTVCCSSWDRLLESERILPERPASEVPADVKQEKTRVTQEKTREREAIGKKQKVAASATVV